MFGRGFESRRLHFITYHKKLKACKTLSLQAFLLKRTFAFLQVCSVIYFFLAKTYSAKPSKSQKTAPGIFLPLIAKLRI